MFLARREAQSKHGKSATKQNTSAASLARRGDPDLSSREISQRVRELRSKTGATGKKVMVNVDHVVLIKMAPNKILQMLAGKLVKVKLIQVK